MPRAPIQDREVSLSRAMHLFWRRGYQATSLKEVEKALQLHPGSIYAAFGSKAELFAAALDRYAVEMSREMSELLATVPSPLEGVCRYLRALARQCAAPPAGTDGPVRACMLVKTVLEAGDRNPEMASHADRLLAEVEVGLTRTLQRAVDLGELRLEVNPRRLARLLQAQIMGLRVFAQRDVPRRAILDLGDDMVALINSYRA